jgi:3-methyladenine DNA glycosylase AlkD
VARRFFKTGPGEYGEGDAFLGVAMPALRRLAREHEGTSLPVVTALLRSRWHEARMLALLILVRQYRRGSATDRRRIASLYLRSRRFINNWDLIDVTAEHILGPAWADDDRGWLTRLASSPRVWDRRLAVMTTFHDIKRGRFGRTLALAERLLGDRHDLVHKAVGWMLREIGKRDRRAEERFLHRHAAHMPRTMLRYAIERLPVDRRRRYLSR